MGGGFFGLTLGDFGIFVATSATGNEEFDFLSSPSVGTVKEGGHEQFKAKRT